MNPSQDLKRVAESVGDFIEYWGFRNIHGRIWAVVFLSPEPVSTLEIINRLEVSKGLVSRSINELLEYKLLIKSGVTTHGRNTYIANEDIGSIVHQVLKTRELVLLEQNIKSLEKLAVRSDEDLAGAGVSQAKLTQLIKLTKENEGLLKNFIKRKFSTVSDWIKFSKLARSFLKL